MAKRKSEGTKKKSRATVAAHPRARAATAKASKPGASAKQHVTTARETTYDVYAPAPSAPRSGARAFVRQRRLDDAAGLTRAQLHEVYRYLYETRRLEEHLVALARQNQVVGGVYRSLGQEATAIGCTYAMSRDDLIQPLIRDLGAALLHCVEPLAVFRQYMARGAGPSGGRDLNLHFSDPSVGMLGPVSMLGAMAPVLAGCLLAARLQGRQRAGLLFIGDGGSSTGAFYEGLNFAVVKKLPMVAVIEANHYAYSTPTQHQLAAGDLVTRARGFGCPVIHLDGNDVLACYEASRQARERGLAGDGPTVLIADTYRRKGHAEHDNQKYVPAGEPDDWAKNNDPVERYTRFLLEGGHAGEAELEALRREVDALLDAARTTAVADPMPDPATQALGVFAEGPQPLPSSSTWYRGGPPLRPADLGGSA